MVATDYDHDMVASTRRRLTPFGKRATTQRVDAAALPYADGSFDVVLSFAMLHHVVDWERAVAEAELGRLPLADLKTRRSIGALPSDSLPADPS